ncbi:hypothetical protein QR680_000146 [Steinernema hermaphroditum]|uniref:Uncharacterized protein n=1 Tax=Steinernema hermaphroditum TaxID=289476 RepID=A0AA39GUC3_9BILA|nr:hypothetical protein QR680_000146 [Steinernema hermaphroditum]
METARRARNSKKMLRLAAVARSRYSRLDSGQGLRRRGRPPPPPHHSGKRTIPPHLVLATSLTRILESNQMGGTGLVIVVQEGEKEENPECGCV